MKLKLSEAAKKKIIDEIEMFDLEDFSGVYCKVTRGFYFENLEGSIAELQVSMVFEPEEFKFEGILSKKVIRLTD